MLADIDSISKPIRKRRVTQEERLQTASYIITDWEKETPGITVNVDPVQLQEDILHFMRECNISTIDDYEASKVKLLRDCYDCFENMNRREKQ